MVIRYRATLAYEGTAYLGFQRQAGNAPTIQGAVEAAIQSVTGMQVTVIGAGRTDTGVHAIGQVIAFDLDWSHSPEELMRALNALLPEDIALQNISRQPGFHPRFDATSRVYRYYILQLPQRHPLMRNRAWHVASPLDGQAMVEAGSLLLGEHDFATFGKAPQGDNTVRKVFRSEWTARQEDDGMLLVYRIEANAFLEHMVRRVVGALVMVGRGQMTVDEFDEAFRRAVLIEGATFAPAHGLVLEAVHYPLYPRGKKAPRVEVVADETENPSEVELSPQVEQVDEPPETEESNERGDAPPEEQ